MKTSTQYREDIKNLMKKASDIDAKCIAENRDPDSTELILKNEILDTVKDYNSIVETMDRQDRMQATLDKPSGKPLTRPLARKHTGSGVEVIEKDKFNSFGSQLAAVMRAGLPGGSVDPRLYNTATGLNESVPSDGGFLVQQDFASTLMQDIFETGVLASRCRRIPISGNSNGIKINGVDETSRVNSRYGGIVGYWGGENLEIMTSRPKFRQIELNLKKLVGLCHVTDEMLDDAASLEAVLTYGFNSEFKFLIDNGIVNGPGANQPLGLLNSGGLVTVAKEKGQKPNTLVAENIINMYSRLFASSRSSAVWLINQNVEPQLFTMSISVGTGGVPLYMPPGGLSALPYGTILGRPVLPIEHAQSLGTAGDIILADLENGYILAEKGGVRTEMSIHVRFVYDEQLFKYVVRLDGQPVRASALTPFNGGENSTQSHFIVTETR